jgi:hypothetical protein
LFLPFQEKTIAQIFRIYYNISMFPAMADIKTEYGSRTKHKNFRFFALCSPFEDRTPYSGDRMPRSGHKICRFGDRITRTGDRTLRSGDRIIHSEDKTPHSEDRTPRPVSKTTHSEQRVTCFEDRTTRSVCHNQKEDNYGV